MKGMRTYFTKVYSHVCMRMHAHIKACIWECMMKWWRLEGHLLSTSFFCLRCPSMPEASLPARLHAETLAIASDIIVCANIMQWVEVCVRVRLYVCNFYTHTHTHTHTHNAQCVCQCRFKHLQVQLYIHMHTWYLKRSKSTVRNVALLCSVSFGGAFLTCTQTTKNTRTNTPHNHTWTLSSGLSLTFTTGKDRR